MSAITSVVADAVRPGARLDAAGVRAHQRRRRAGPRPPRARGSQPPQASFRTSAPAAHTASPTSARQVSTLITTSGKRLRTSATNGDHPAHLLGGVDDLLAGAGLHAADVHEVRALARGRLDAVQRGGVGEGGALVVERVRSAVHDRHHEPLVGAVLVRSQAQRALAGRPAGAVPLSVRPPGAPSAFDDMEISLTATARRRAWHDVAVLYFQFLVVAAVFGAIAWVAAGRGGGLDDPRQDRPEPALADDRQLGKDDIDGARFAVGLPRLPHGPGRPAVGPARGRDRPPGPAIAELTRPVGSRFGELGLGYEPVARAQEDAPGPSGAEVAPARARAATAVVQPGFGPGVGVRPTRPISRGPADQSPRSGQPAVGLVPAAGECRTPSRPVGSSVFQLSV